MRRWLKLILLTMSTLLLAATLAMWARSQWVMTELRAGLSMGSGKRAEVRHVRLRAHRGSLAVIYVWEVFDLSDSAIAARFRQDEPTVDRLFFAESGPQPLPALESNDVWGIKGWERWGFGWEWRAISPPGGRHENVDVGGHTYRYYGFHSTTLAAPWWFLAVLLAAMPARAIWRKTRRRPRAAHLCAACGYDLRATPDAAGPKLATCPECGAMGAAPKA